MRLNRRPGAEALPASSGVLLSPSTYGLDGFPDFDPGALAGTSIREKAQAYVDALHLEPSTRRGMLLWRVECLIEDHERERAGLPSVEDETLAEIGSDDV